MFDQRVRPLSSNDITWNWSYLDSSISHLTNVQYFVHSHTRSFYWMRDQCNRFVLSFRCFVLYWLTDRFAKIHYIWKKLLPRVVTPSISGIIVDYRKYRSIDRLIWNRLQFVFELTLTVARYSDKWWSDAKCAWTILFRWLIIVHQYANKRYAYQNFNRFLRLVRKDRRFVFDRKFSSIW